MLKPINFDELSNRLEECKTRGITLYDNDTRKMDFVSFAEIIKKAKAIAAEFHCFGIVPGNKIILSARTDIAFPVLWIACMISGVIIVPIAPAEAFIAEGAFRNRIRGILPYVDKYLCYENEFAEIKQAAEESNSSIEIILLKDFVDKATKSNHSFNTKAAISDPDKTAFIQFTSGSTNFPKGIMITQGNLLENVFTLSKRWQVNPEESILGSWLPLYHDMGLVGLLLVSLITQSNLVLLPPYQFIKNPLYFLKIISEYKINICCMTNFSLLLILRRLELNKDKGLNLDLSHLKYMGIGAEPVNINILKLFETNFFSYGLKKNVVSPGYGLAESTLAVTVADIYDGYKESLFEGRIYPTNGRPLDGVQVKIENHDCNPTQKGIIKIKSPSVAQYALVNGKKTKITDTEGFYNTKDYGYFDNGNLVILGRSDNMFIINGENFFPHDVEKIISNTGILKRSRAACFSLSVEESKTNSVDVYFAYETKTISLMEKQQIDEVIKKEVAKQLGIQLTAVLSLKMKSIPITTSGKIKHKALASLYQKGGLEDKLISV